MMFIRLGALDSALLSKCSSAVVLLDPDGPFDASKVFLMLMLASSRFCQAALQVAIQARQPPSASGFRRGPV